MVVGHSGRVTREIDNALDLIFKDLTAASIPLPRVEPKTWQECEPSESVMLFAADRSGMGVWFDLGLDDDHALVHLGRSGPGMGG